MKRRIDALKQLQVKCAHIEAKFYEEVHDLERKYAALYQPLFDKVRRLNVSYSCVNSVCIYVILLMPVFFFSYHREESLLMEKLNPQMQSQSGTVKMRKKKN